MKLLRHTIAALLLTLNVARAHDFWLEPASFRPEPGSILAVHVLVGHGVERTPFLRREEHIRRFVLLGSAGEKPLVGRPDDDPAGYVRLEREGIQLVGYRSNPAQVELLPEKFESYLREEGLEQVIEARDELGERQEPGRESYSRCAKALIDVGGHGHEGYDRRLGFELELVPEANPFTLALDPATKKLAPLPVVLLHEGQGLPDALVDIQSLDDLELCLEQRTDASGRLLLELPREGRWLLTAVQMQRAPDGSAFQWESLWASLSFETGATTADPGCAPH